MVRPGAHQEVQFSCGQMLVPQSRQSNIRRERVVPKNVRSFTTQLFQIEATRSVLEWRETKAPSFRISGHEHRSDSFSRDSDWAGDERVAPMGRHLLKAYTRKQKIISRSRAEAVQKQCRSRTVCSSIRSVRREKGSRAWCVFRVLQ